MQALDLPNLRDAPFRLGVSPADAVAHRSWRRVHDAVLAALADGPARVAILGETGTGKTLLLHALAGALPDRAVLATGASGIPAPLPSGGVLLVDDADKLDADTVERLLRGDGSCVIAAPPSFAERLPTTVLVQTLSPLPADEVARFVAVRLAEAGQRRDLLDPDAVLTLARLSGGVPRQLNALAGAAVFLAGLDGAARVGRRQVEEAAAMRDGEADVAPAAAFRTEPAEPKPEPEDAGPQATAKLAEAAPLQAPPEPLVPGISRRAAPASARMAAAVGAVVLIGAALVGYVRSGTPARPGSVPVPVASTPSPVAAPAAAPPVPASSELPAAGLNQAPAAASRPRSAAARDATPAVASPAVSEPGSPTGPRVVLHYRAGAAAEADSLAALLAKQGAQYGRIETRSVPGTPHVPAIRFFHEEDVAAAWALRSALSATGEDWQVRDFRRFQPRPRRGTLEVWIR